MRKVMLVLAVAALAVLGTELQPAQGARSAEQGRAGVQERPVSGGRRALQDGGRTRSRLSRPPVCIWPPPTCSSTFRAPNRRRITRWPQAAFDQFKKVLEQEPKNTVAIASIASLNLNQKKWDEAQQWYEKLIAVDPKNAEAYYSLGFIAWSQVVSGLRHGPRQAGHEAGRSRSASRTRRSRKS